MSLTQTQALEQKNICKGLGFADVLFHLLENKIRFQVIVSKEYISFGIEYQFGKDYDCECEWFDVKIKSQQQLRTLDYFDIEYDVCF